MADFMKLLNEKQNDVDNVSTTENGAIVYRTTGKALLDLNFSTASRNTDGCMILHKWWLAFMENPELALKWLFFARDIRKGMGEKRIFKLIFKYMAENEPDKIRHLITPEIIGEYGCWKDILILFDTPLEKEALHCIYKQLSTDINDCDAGNPISLLAKWLPSINTSSEKSRQMAKKIQRDNLLTEEGYRKILSRLRKYLKVVERQMSDGNWSDIDYQGVPSIANLQYSQAFLRHDPERRSKYLMDATTGKAKINSKDLYPHQITTRVSKLIAPAHYSVKSINGCIQRVIDPGTKKYLQLHKQDFEFVEAMWNNLPNLIPDSASILVVRDGSGSMYSHIGDGVTRAIDVADALTLYFAENLKGAYHNSFITFSSKPEVVTIPDNIMNEIGSYHAACDGDKVTLLDKLALLRNYSDCTNTNIEAVFMLILNIAIENNLQQDELPKNILIVSDMEFDGCISSNKRLFDSINERFIQAGYKIPHLIFWNVNSRTNTIPVCKNELGVSLVSGFSIQIMNMVLSEKLDPYEVLLDTLNSERYSRITYPGSHS